MAFCRVSPAELQLIQGWSLTELNIFTSTGSAQICVAEPSMDYTVNCMLLVGLQNLFQLRYNRSFVSTCLTFRAVNHGTMTTRFTHSNFDFN